MAQQIANVFGEGSTPQTLGSLNGLFKKIYGDKLENVIPEFTQLQVDIPWRRAKKLGLVFEQPVVIGLEQGVTYMRSGAGVVDLEDAAAGRIRPAQVSGSQHVLRAAVDYESLFAGEGAPEAFENSMGVIVRNMVESIRRRLEIDLFYGQNPLGIGQVSTAVSTLITVITAQWAPGIWAGMEQAHIEFWNDDDPLVTQRDAATDFYITAVDLDARTITVDTAPTTVVANDVILFKGQYSSSAAAWQVMAGIHKILTNTGTLFGISASQFNLWKGNGVSAASLGLTFTLFLRGCAKVVSKGASGTMTAYINPTGWAQLMNDQAALRRFAKEDGNSIYEVGADAIRYHNQTGQITIKSHPVVKEGYAYVIMPSLFRRIGATDVTFDSSRMVGVMGPANQFFLPLQDKNAVEVRCYSHQALFTDAPGKTFYISSIVNF